MSYLRQLLTQIWLATQHHPATEKVGSLAQDISIITSAICFASSSTRQAPYFLPLITIYAACSASLET